MKRKSIIISLALLFLTMALPAHSSVLYNLSGVETKSTTDHNHEFEVGCTHRHSLFEFGNTQELFLPPMLRAYIPDEDWNDGLEYGCPKCGDTVDRLTGKCHSCAYVYADGNATQAEDSPIGDISFWLFSGFCAAYVLYRLRYKKIRVTAS